MRQNQEFLANAGFFSRSYYQSMHEFWRLLVQWKLKVPTCHSIHLVGFVWVLHEYRRWKCSKKYLSR